MNFYAVILPAFYSFNSDLFFLIINSRFFLKGAPIKFFLRVRFFGFIIPRRVAQVKKIYLLHLKFLNY